MFAGKKSAQIREILISESAWEEMTCLFAPSLAELIDLVYGQYGIFDIADDNDEVKGDFIDELRKRIAPLIGNEGFNAFYDYFYG
ncbi:hypothetical protein N8Q50_12920 [Enterobacter hormaechei subsp. hoffmannii]|nr:hypothetical protein [Enterobacter hormaechei subsp. hoffmannii]